MGAYVLEEHFEKRLIENNGRRDGPILGDFESDIPIDRAWPPVQVYKKNTWKKNDPQLLSQAIQKMEKFQRGEIGIDDAFDSELLGRYVAICDVLNTWHGALGKSVKFYFNPITQKFEPIGFDGHFLVLDTTSIFSDNSMTGDRRKLRWPLNEADMLISALFDRKLTSNRRFVEAYIRSMERLSQPGYLETFFSAISDEIERHLGFISKDFPIVDLWYFASWGSKLRDRRAAPGLFKIFSVKDFITRRDYISRRLHPNEYVGAFVARTEKGKIQLSVRNRHSLPIEFGKFRYKGNVYSPSSELIVQGVRKSQFGEWRVTDAYSIDANATSDNAAPVINNVRDGYVYRPMGAEKWLFQEFYFHYFGERTQWDRPGKGNIKEISALPFITINEALKTISLHPGKIVLDRSLTLPEGYKLAKRGGEIDLIKGARIIVNGPVRFEGSEDASLVITSSDLTGQGIVVMEAKGTSILDNVVFSNLSILSNQQWNMTSTTFFYKSDVNIRNVTFMNINAEDALNIVASNFHIDGVKFMKVSSDAFDSDFSVGSVRNSRFENIGNDGIDVSGTNISIKSIYMKNINDKGISVGEASNMNLIDFQIVSSEIGIAVKDGSMLRAEKVDTTKSKMGVAVYKKKSEYESPIAVLKESKIGTYLMEPDSRLRVNGKERGWNSESLKDQISTE